MISHFSYTPTLVLTAADKLQADPNGKLYQRKNKEKKKKKTVLVRRLQFSPQTSTLEKRRSMLEIEARKKQSKRERRNQSNHEFAGWKIVYEFMSTQAHTHTQRHSNRHTVEREGLKLLQKLRCVDGEIFQDTGCGKELDEKTERGGLIIV